MKFKRIRIPRTNVPHCVVCKCAERECYCYDKEQGFGVCYQCCDGDHALCVGVPCSCSCEGKS